ncbi:TolC family protein [Maribacter sp. 1_MG-2023]|uniref:TolC family protein n=1 Tax=Maribacter sp. 1_MG-2023 TaxID=3062677 RepID=UPI0026E30C4A|nr:TolC family protein [Maribacter sp. 1_MG-2023]MDO6471383.1 TolC family protein [Maribacter sp. 1_MG-2023]
MKVKITGLLLIFSVVFGMAQQKKWTLEECVYYAVENNLTVKQFELDLENAIIDESDAIGNMLPTLSASSNASKNVGFTIVSTSNQPVLGNQSTVSVSGNINSDITLYNGLRNFKQLQRAKLNAISNQYRLENLKDDIELRVANAYLQILSNKEALAVSKSQYAITEQDLKRTKELVDSGIVPRGDLLDLEATAAGQEQQMVNNESLVLISRINLAQLLQITDYDNFDITNETFEVPPSDILNNSPKTIFTKALEFRNDIKFSESTVDLAEKDLEIAKGAYAPTLSGFFQYGARYSDATEPLPDGNGGFFTPGFIDQLWIFDGIAYGAQLNVPIFNGHSTRNSVKRSRINLEKSKLQFELDKLDLETTVNQSYVDVTTFAKAYYAAEKTLEARRLAFNYSKERFDVGLMNSFEYSQAQSRVDNAEADLIRTKYDYIFRLKILEFYYGIPLSLE